MATHSETLSTGTGSGPWRFHQMRFVLRRTWAFPLFISVGYVGYELVRLWPSLFRSDQGGVLAGPGRWYTQPNDILILLVAAWMAFWLWRDRPPSRRDELLSQPAGRLGQQLTLVGTGAGLIVLGTLCMLYVFLGILALRLDMSSFHLLFGFLPPAGMWPIILGPLNAYLLASVLALTTERPFYWGLWLTLGLCMSWFLLAMAESNLLHVLLAPIVSTWGVLAGLGITIWDGSGENIPWQLLAMVVWTLLLLVSNIWAASRHVER